ncbi:hypothetical protein C0J52_19854 [Blattella germanica]|nr:hypothetical protein C0J52_19854 [Blattella germanica]
MTIKPQRASESWRDDLQPSSQSTTLFPSNTSSKSNALSGQNAIQFEFLPKLLKRVCGAGDAEAILAILEDLEENDEVAELIEEATKLEVVIQPARYVDVSDEYDAGSDIEGEIRVLSLPKLE